MRFSRQGYPFPSPGNLPTPGTEPRSPAWQADSLLTELQGSPIVKAIYDKKTQMQNSKMVALGGLSNSYENKRSKRQRRKGKIYPFECRVPKSSKER